MSRACFGPYIEVPLAFLSYSPAIAAAAERLIVVLKNELATAEVSHVGSTSIPGMPGKNSINILIATPKDSYPEILTRLESLGFNHHHYNKFDTPDRPVRVAQYTEGVQSYPVHAKIVFLNEKDHKAHLFFREYLIKNPEEAIRYAALKQKLVEDGSTLEEYALAKQFFVRTVLDKQPQ